MSARSIFRYAERRFSARWRFPLRYAGSDLFRAVLSGMEFSFRMATATNCRPTCGLRSSTNALVVLLDAVLGEWRAVTKNPGRVCDEMQRIRKSRQVSGDRVRLVYE